MGGNNQGAAKETIEEIEVMELEEVENEAILENKSGLPAHQKVSRNEDSGGGYSSGDSDEDEYTESFLDHARRGKYIDDNQYNDIFRQINLINKESEPANILTDKEKEELENSIRASIKSAEELEEQRKIMQYASIGNPDMAHDYLVALESPPMTLKEQAEILQKGASIYNSFAEEHPIIAEYGTSATLLGVKTLVAGAAGAIEHLIVEVRGRVIGSMLGLDAAINGSINQAAKIFKKIDVSLSDEESHTLAAAYILGPIMLAGSAQDIKFATSKIAGKLKFQDKVKIENEFEVDRDSFGKFLFKGEVPENLTKLEYHTAKDKIVAKPSLLKDYVKEMEYLTGQKIPDIQIKELKKALKETEFVKGTKETTSELRKYWDNNKDKIISEWEKNTEQQWPVYQTDVYKKNGTGIKFYKGQKVSAHHIIELSHGGSNKWWNLHPSHVDIHSDIHRTDSNAHYIFRKNVKKD